VRSSASSTKFAACGRILNSHSRYVAVVDRGRLLYMVDQHRISLEIARPATAAWNTLAASPSRFSRSIWRPITLPALAKHPAKLAVESERVRAAHAFLTRS